MSSPTFLSSLFAAIALSFIVASSPAVADTPPLSAAQIDALVAPVALYPDQLLAKVFIASSYPLEVVEADRWARANASLKGSTLDSSIAKQSWDDSVKSLAHTPTVLKLMSDRIDWTQKLGDAFLAQQNDVMDSVQRLRKQAQASGSLKDTAQQKVAVQDNVIVIQPTKPDVVYVPYYNPQVVYGAWAYPAYPPYYWPPPAGYAYGAGVAAGIGFVTGAVVTAAFWNNGFGWHDHNVYVNNNVNIHNNFNNNFNNIHNNNIHGQTWHHDPAHRQGVSYGNNDLRQKYGKQAPAGSASRQNFRGFDNSTGAGSRTAGNTPRANNTTRPGSNAGALNHSGRSGMDYSAFGQGGHGGGFDGIGNGASTRQFSARGQGSLRSGGGHAFGGRRH